MNETQEKYWNLMTKRFSGMLTQQESVELENWLSAVEANRKLLQELETVWTQTESYGQQVTPDVDKAWHKVAAKAGLEQKMIPLKGKTNIFKLVTLAKAAAAVIILVITGWGIYQYMQQPQLVEIATRANEQKEVALPDGSTIWLNQNSAVTYNKKMEKANKRLVKLKGEAFFDVAKNPQKPFVIEAQETETEVLGTSFNIQARDESKVVEVSVVTGKVRFAPKDRQKEIVLEPGTVGVYTIAGHTLQKKSSTTINFLYWKNGTLNFENTALQQVLDDLGKSYEVQFVVQNKDLTNLRITTTFENETLENILAELETLLDVKFVKTGNTYRVY